MELLTILYAVLAAVTGIGGGDRVALVERAAMAAQAEAGADAGCAIEIGVAHAVKAHRVAQKPQPLGRIVAVVRELRTVALPQVPALFDMASFANRRE